MKNYSFLAGFIACMFCVMSINAQETFKHWSVGVEGGTYGAGITAATSLSQKFILRAGFDMMGLNYSKSFNWDIDGFAPAGTAGKSIPLTASLSDIQWRTTHGKLLVDFYPVENGIFSVTAGLFFGSNSLSAQGKVKNYAQLMNQYNLDNVAFDLDGTVVQPNKDGSFDAKVRLGNGVKPYLGIGLGRAIAANKRLSLKLDLGVVLQGNYKLDSPNVLSGNITSTVNNDLSDHVPTYLIKLWPMLNLSLSYKIM